MDLAELRSRRLFAQGLRGGPPVTATPTPVEVVSRSMAVQAQEYLPAQWGLAQRLSGDGRPDAAGVAALVDGGEILRTHVLRPTWHFVTPADARWLVELSAERVHRVNGTYYRRHGVDGADATASLDVVAAALADGHRTRAELSAALEAAGRPSSGLGFTLLLMYAELERIAISGASAGKQRTYAAFDERVPAAPPRPRADALAELAERFLLTRGPASARDFSAWSGFSLGDARTALADAADRTAGRIEPITGPDDEQQWQDAAIAAAWRARYRPDDPGRNVVDLLQAYDEYIMGHAAPRAYLQPSDRADPVHPEFPLHAMMVDGVMVGRWAPVLEAKRAAVRIVPWRVFSRAEERSLAASVAEVERFLGVPVTVEREEPTGP
ncbi:winged helix DNA-binding domain-containing protein [Agromyces sp. NPDC058484]|uniref:winged helix DNA-binding domain-containing protein n=1 Tax=Agromyces sp. NPDC058484 TaxID=3346524 RepID=UPI00365636E4